MKYNLTYADGHVEQVTSQRENNKWVYTHPRYGSRSPICLQAPDRFIKVWADIHGDKVVKVNVVKK